MDEIVHVLLISNKIAALSIKSMLKIGLLPRILILSDWASSSQSTEQSQCRTSEQLIDLCHSPGSGHPYCQTARNVFLISYQNDDTNQLLGKFVIALYHCATYIPILSLLPVFDTFGPLIRGLDIVLSNLIFELQNPTMFLR